MDFNKKVHMKKATSKRWKVQYINIKKVFRKIRTFKEDYEEVGVVGRK